MADAGEQIIGLVPVVVGAAIIDRFIDDDRPRRRTHHHGLKKLKW
jgi:hypothetical protein